MSGLGDRVDVRRRLLESALIGDATRAAFGGLTVQLNVSDMVIHALFLSRAGLNVFPIPVGKKTPFRGFSPKNMLSARLLERHIPDVFEGAVNLAVMAGRTSGNLLILDAETFPAWLQLIERLQRARVPVYAVKTGRGGHVYLRCADGEIRNAPPVGDVEVIGNGRYAVGPASIHGDTGVVYELTYADGDTVPTLSLSDLQALFPELDLTVETPTGTGGAPLSGGTRELLSGQTPAGRRNNQLYTATRELLAFGFSELDVYDQLIRAALSVGLSRREAEATVRSGANGFYRDGRQAAGGRADDPASLYRQALAWSAGREWSGRAGSTDLAVFRALCERCRLEQPSARAGQQITFRASERELNEMTGISRLTIRRSLRRLADADIIRRTSVRATGARYGFGAAVVLAVTGDGAGRAVTNPLLETARTVGKLRPTHAAFDRKALGANAFDVLSALVTAGDVPLSGRAIARAVPALSRKKVRRALAQLERWRLAERLDDGWIISVDGDRLAERLDEVAITSGAVADRRERVLNHAIERAYRLAELLLKARGRLIEAQDVRESGIRALSARLAARRGGNTHG